jgi:hypothetical protein
MEKPNITTIVRQCIDRIKRDYEDYREGFLTEGDATSSLFCKLKNVMRKHGVTELEIHRELRPYALDGAEAKVIRLVDGAVDWAIHEPKNAGAVVDLAIIERDEKYFNEAEKTSSQEYWRILSYPLDAFVACIEVKVRVAGNIRRIRKDIEKLDRIRNTLQKRGKNCLVHLMVLDRRAPDKSIRTIAAMCRKLSIEVTIAKPDQPISEKALRSKS